MDQRHRLIDCFLISVPLVLCPTPQQQDDANRYIEMEAIDNFEDIFQEIPDFHEENLTTTYMFDVDAQSFLREMNYVCLQLKSI